MGNPRRDWTALTIVEIDPITQSDPALRAPTYRPVARRQWQGTAHTRLYAEIRALAETWRPGQVVVDATGVGAGLAAFLGRALPGRVIPFIFNQSSKSKLGWDFLNIIDEGRWREGCGAEAPGNGGRMDANTAQFFEQLRYCQFQLLPGPGRLIRWGAPEGGRIHDDWVISAALCAVLEGKVRVSNAGAGVVQRRDPLEEMDGGF